eukprot:2101115-Pyramimonas_sp.AAC.1
MGPWNHGGDARLCLSSEPGWGPSRSEDRGPGPRALCPLYSIVVVCSSEVGARCIRGIANSGRHARKRRNPDIKASP